MRIDEFRNKDKEYYTITKICNTILDEPDFTLEEKGRAAALRTEVIEERENLYRRFLNEYGRI